jgi:SagB-type dehydrogenase family enzyme
MHELFEATKLTKSDVAKNSGFLDWNTQPSRFKCYPEFSFRYRAQELGAYAWLLDLRQITDSRLIAKKPYDRLNTPSAGNLHPIELYVQIRNIKGILSGIYHIDVAHQELVLIREIEKEGLECSLGMNMRYRGIILLLSLVPFRSFWKYGLRSWRYLYLDAGHQIATIWALLKNQQHNATIVSGFDAKTLNYDMGFEDKEFTCKVFALGESSDRKAEVMSSALMHVLPTDYTEAIPLLKQQLEDESIITDTVLSVPECITISEIDTLLKTRRSAREFTPLSLQKPLVEQLMNMFECSASLILLRCEGYESGIYRRKHLLRKGFFPKECVDLLVAQRFIHSAAVVIVLHVKNPDYQEHVNAGILAQWMYLFAEQNRLGCTGVGAYYDDALRSFLDTDDEIVYVIALGARS